MHVSAVNGAGCDVKAESLAGAAQAFLLQAFVNRVDGTTTDDSRVGSLANQGWHDFVVSLSNSPIVTCGLLVSRPESQTDEPELPGSVDLLIDDVWLE